MSSNDNHVSLSYRACFAVLAVLVLMLLLNVGIASLHLGEIFTFIGLVISCIMAFLVIYLFMHVKYDSLMLKSFLTVPFICLLLFIGLTYVDTLFR